MVVPGLSVMFQSAKTKLIVLSSLLGVGSIIYFTKNYIQYGSFLGGKQSAKTKIFGGKKVVIKQNINNEGMCIFLTFFFTVAHYKKYDVIIYSICNQK